MDIKVTKEYKNGNKIVEISRTVITRFKVSNDDEYGLEVDGEKTISDPIYNDSYISDAIWKKLKDCINKIRILKV